MSAPKHLWAGDWEGDSEAAARERQRRLATPAPAQPEPAQPEPAQPEAVRVPAPRAPRRRRSLPRPRLTAAQVRLGLVVAGVALLVTGGAYGLSRLIDTGPSVSSSVGPTRAWLGLQMGSLPTGAVVVTSVASGSPAATAGLRAGDVVTQIESRPVGAPVNVTEAVDALRAGDSVEIEVLRGSTTYIRRVTLAARPPGYP